MTFPSLLRALRERWLILAAGAVVGVLVALLITWLTPRTYAATSSLYVSAFDDSRSAQSAYQGSLLSQQRVKSYTELLVSARVLQPVSDRLGLGESAADLARDVSVGSSSDSTILTVTVTDRDARRAADVANAIGDRFIQVVGELERPPDSQAAYVVVNTVDRAGVVAVPVSPRPVVNVVVGLVVGLVAAAGAGLVRGSLDTTVRSREDLARIVGSPALGSVPVSPGLAAANAPAVPHDHQHTEAVRRIRTNLLFADVDNPPTSLVVTSSAPGEGKTTLVCALASALSANVRVAVVEADLRLPTMAARLGLPESVGLTDVLARRVDLARATQRWGRIDVLVAGTPPPNPNELLSSRLAGEIIARLAADHDAVLIDSPPLGPVSDAAVLGRQADGVLLVCRSAKTSRAQVQASLDALSQVGARLTGTVLSMSERETRSEYYGYRRAHAKDRAPSRDDDTAGAGRS